MPLKSRQDVELISLAEAVEMFTAEFSRKYPENRFLMDAIENFSRDLTILLVARRLTTVQRCDTIVEMGNGRVVAQRDIRTAT